MPHDTTKDPRILVARFACSVLDKNVKQKTRASLLIAREKVIALASTCESAVMGLLYLYQEPRELASSEPMATLLDAAKALRGAFEQALAVAGDPSLATSNVAWCLRTFEGLPLRLGNPGATMASGVDLVVVRIQNVGKSGQLWKTRVSDGHTDFTVMTNLPDIKVGMTPAVAFLPPREVGGIVSEAMFLGSKSVAKPPGTLLAETEADARDAAAILHDEVTKIGR